ncbi:MAG: hydantoinase B/oxoprolinase family protein [Actinobacteria bacterium]|nr:hydantoinase B/oxoprolinase family protein [Actinomycetota bacterium]
MSVPVDPVFLRVAAGSLAAACDEMGEVLVRAAHSANIKERRDCSTGLFDPAGEMTMQAEHIPVHLGAMPAAVEALLGESHAPGDGWMLNDPYTGGTHLPDITVVTPIFTANGDSLGFAACRAHHADVGGDAPGSMPADSTRLDQEGVVIPPTRFAHGGKIDHAVLDAITRQMRNPAQRTADLRAQLAACRRGESRVREFADRYGADAYREALAAVLDYAERQTRAGIAALADGEYAAEDFMEDDARGTHDLSLRLKATVTGDRLTLDFTGSDAQHEGNLNCPLAVTLSACYFAVRVLTAPDVPACAGAYRPVEVIAPPGTLLNAQPPAAVAGGNVETSSRVADLVLAAFGRAQGQGTMNNFTLGNERFTHYETLGGGQGACPDAPGPSAVHVAMSNTLNTPVEALELEFPLRVREYALRRASGGHGAQPGGDGVVREIEALETIEWSLIAERRRYAPRGAAGGGDGTPGRDFAAGEAVAGKARGRLTAGQTLRIETPGGGGHGHF